MFIATRFFPPHSSRPALLVSEGTGSARKVIAYAVRFDESVQIGKARGVRLVTPAGNVLSVLELCADRSIGLSSVAAYGTEDFLGRPELSDIDRLAERFGEIGSLPWAGADAVRHEGEEALYNPRTGERLDQ